MGTLVQRRIGLAPAAGILLCAAWVGTDCAGPWLCNHGGSSVSAQQPSAAAQEASAAAEQPAAKTEEEPMRHTNALAQETSPYLLQHAHNPVNWHPWGEAALALARQQNKPIFLSVGYSTCYWCHVMERESFESEAVAAVLNEHFIAIKVDREQRPDIDEQYLLATQLMTGRGGWPNSVWLTPDGRPWMAGTYFPPDQFVTALEQLAKVWREQPDAVQRQADAVSAAIKNAVTSPLGDSDADTLTGPALVARALEQTRASFDTVHGGFGDAPKFPQHGQLRLLANAADSMDDPQLTVMLTRTLDAMWRGGIHDHVGGGFHRYATDARWFLPHFEKMLYDNAQLMDAYAQGYRLTGQQRYRNAVDDIFAWLSREMTHSEGGFYSALDSESEGEEGKFYVWSMQEIQDILGADDTQRFATIYGFESEGNFAEEATGKRTGGNIPYLNRGLEQIAAEEGVAVDALEQQLASLRQRLLAARSGRPRPHLDDKILAGWNGLMITGLARAAQALDEPRYSDAAARAATFILREMSGDDDLLYRSWRAGKAELPGYLEDYAYLARGLLDLYEATAEDRWLKESQRLAEAMLQRFEDTEQGGFFFTSGEHAELLTRSKNLLGSGNLPLANGVAAETLLRLSRVSGVADEKQARFRRSAERTAEALAGFTAQSPGAAESLLVVHMMLADVQPNDVVAQAEPKVAAETAAVARNRQPPLTVVASASEQQLHPGQTIEVSVQVEIDANWHLYAENADVDFVIPSSASLVESEFFKAGKTEASGAVVREDPVFGQTVELYEQRVTFRIPVTVESAAKPGKTVLPVQLRTQACDATRCLAARTTRLEIPVTIVAGESN